MSPHLIEISNSGLSIFSCPALLHHVIRMCYYVYLYNKFKGHLFCSFNVSPFLQRVVQALVHENGLESRKKNIHTHKNSFPQKTPEVACNTSLVVPAFNSVTL